MSNCDKTKNIAATANLQRGYWKPGDHLIVGRTHTLCDARGDT